MSKNWQGKPLVDVQTVVDLNWFSYNENRA
jgi:hypothetical protein